MGDALSTVLAGIGLAQIYLVFTPFTLETGRTGANECIKSILTRSSIETRTGGALIYIGTTSGSVISPGTFALELSNLV